MTVQAAYRKWSSYLVRTYGITANQYEQVLADQGGGCAICLKPSHRFKRRLSVDHDHHTGEIRGLLCGHCNLRVIGRQRDADLLSRAAEYLRQGTGWYVPTKKYKKRKKVKCRKSI